MKETGTAGECCSIQKGKLLGCYCLAVVVLVNGIVVHRVLINPCSFFVPRPMGAQSTIPGTVHKSRSDLDDVPTNIEATSGSKMNMKPASFPGDQSPGSADCSSGRKNEIFARPQIESLVLPQYPVPDDSSNEPVSSLSSYSKIDGMSPKLSPGSVGSILDGNSALAMVDSLVQEGDTADSMPAWTPSTRATGPLTIAADSDSIVSKGKPLSAATNFPTESGNNYEDREPRPTPHQTTPQTGSLGPKDTFVDSLGLKYTLEIPEKEQGEKWMVQAPSRTPVGTQSSALEEGVSSNSYKEGNKKVAEKKRTILSLEKAVDSAAELLAAESRKVKEREVEIDAMKVNLSNSQAELEDNLQQMNLLREKSAIEIQDLETRLDKAQQHTDKVSSKLSIVNDEKRMMQERIANLESQWEEMKRERDEARSRVSDLENELRDRDRVRRGLHNRLMELTGNIRVYVRVRPPLPGEHDTTNNETSKLPFGQKRKSDEQVRSHSIFRYPGYGHENKKSKLGAGDPTNTLLEVTEPKRDRGGLNERQKKWTFGFDNVFNPSHGQEDIWDATDPLVQSAIDGYNVTIFAYGQTGSGKTFTMLGEQGNNGVMTRAIKKLFDAKQAIERLESTGSRVELSLELFEIYNEKVRDLLATECVPKGTSTVNGNKKTGNVILPTKSELEVAEILKRAQKRRCAKATASNAVSSRSHMLCTIRFQVISSNNGALREGKLIICDLAGCERLGKSHANAQVGVSI